MAYTSRTVNKPSRLVKSLALALVLTMTVTDVVSFQYQSQLSSTPSHSRQQSSLLLRMVASSSPPKLPQQQQQQPKTQYPNPNLTDPWYSTRIQKDMGYSKKVKSLYLRHVVVERKETAELALQWYMQLSAGEDVASGNNTETTVELHTSKDPFGDVARQLSACSVTRDEGGKIGWVDLPSSENEPDSDAAASVELTMSTLIPDDVLEELVSLQPKAGDVHIVGPSSSTNQVHVVRIEELYVPNILLPSAIDRLYAGDKNNGGNGDVKLGSFHGVNALVPRNKLKGHGVMPTVPKFERHRATGDEESQEQSPRTYAIQTNGCQMNVADSERLEGILQDELGLSRIAVDGSTRQEELQNADVVIFNTCSIRDHAEQKLYDALGPFRARKRSRNSKKGNSDFALIVTGCVAQQEGKALLRKIPEIDVVLGPQYVPYLGSVLEQIEWGHQLVVTAPTIIADNYKAAGAMAADTTTDHSVVLDDSGSTGRSNSSSNSNTKKKHSEGITKQVAIEKASTVPTELLPENDDFSAKPIRGHSVRAWVNVIYGCNEHCTYCV
jgi:hypothetical protein